MEWNALVSAGGLWSSGDHLLAFESDRLTEYRVDGHGHVRGMPGRAAEVILAHRAGYGVERFPSPSALSGGGPHQHAVLLDGPLLNHAEVRRILVQCGRAFRTDSPSEVILRAYEEWGPDCVHRLVGQFAVAVLDVRARTLLVARDAFGARSLYFVESASGIGFATSASALLPLLAGRPSANPQALYDYLEHGTTDPMSRTLFDGVQSLPPGHFAVVGLRSPSVAGHRYWPPDVDHVQVAFDDAAESVRDCFYRCVDLHTRGCAAVGATLSGGVDSSAIVMAMREVAGPPTAIHTFSYLGDRDTISEAGWIGLVNRAAGATPHEVALSQEHVSSHFLRMARLQEFPVTSLAVFAQELLYERAAETGVPVVLDGSCADAVLGYPSLTSLRLARLVRTHRWDDAGRLLLAILQQGLARPETYRTLFAALQARSPTVRRLRLRVRRRRTRSLVRGSWVGDHGISAREGSGELDADGFGGVLLRSISSGRIPGLLRFARRNAHAHGVQVGLPFATPQLAELLLGMPEDYLAAPGLPSKALFRHAMRGAVPAPILGRTTKIGFAVPMRPWLPRMPAVLDSIQAAKEIPAVNWPVVARWLGTLRSGSQLPQAESYLMWRVAGLVAWGESFDVDFG